MHNVEPQVYIVNASMPVESGILAWMEERGVSQERRRSLLEDGYNHPVEQIVSLAGKRCYNSFEPGLNPNVTKTRTDFDEYIANVLKSGHGCYDGETEVLTLDGWKRWDEVTGKETFATLNQKTRELEYHLASGFIKKQYKGPMYSVEGSAVNLLVTPNHNMFVNICSTQVGRKKNNFELIKAEDLDDQHHCYLKTANYSSGILKYSDDEMWLIGFAIGDGHQPPDSKVIHFHLKRSRKIKKLIEKLSALDLVASVSDNTFSVDYHRNIGMYNATKQKRIPKELMNSSNLQHLYQGLIDSDGSVAITGTLFDTTSKELSDQFFEVCLKIGKACTLSQAPSTKDRSGSFGNKQIYRHNVISRSLRPEVNQGLRSQRSSKWVKFNGMVYCVEVPNNTLFVRRNGKAVWCGNSVFEHATVSFAIEGVSRVFTAELNRHRAGMAISEASLRYIRFEDVGYWIPSSLKPHKDDTPVLSEKKLRSRLLFQRCFTEAEKAYTDLGEIWKEDMKDFDAKKKLTSMFRRIIPMGCAVGGVWTGNLRAWRHIIALRTSPYAEEEIRLVAGMIAEQLNNFCPSAMQDFKWHPETGEWIPDNEKI